MQEAVNTGSARSKRWRKMFRDTEADLIVVKSTISFAKYICKCRGAVSLREIGDLYDASSGETYIEGRIGWIGDPVVETAGGPSGERAGVEDARPVCAVSGHEGSAFTDGEAQVGVCGMKDHVGEDEIGMIAETQGVVGGGGDSDVCIPRELSFEAGIDGPRLATIVCAFYVTGVEDVDEVGAVGIDKEANSRGRGGAGHKLCPGGGEHSRGP